MRLIDADALKEDIDNLRLFKKWIREEIKQHIDNAPTVDLTKNQAYDKGFITAMKLYSRPQGEEIIRCPDCRFYHKKWHSDKRMKEKGYWCCWCGCHDDWVGGTNGFCSLAERKEDETN